MCGVTVLTNLYMYWVVGRHVNYTRIMTFVSYHGLLTLHLLIWQPSCHQVVTMLLQPSDNFVGKLTGLG